MTAHKGIRQVRTVVLTLATVLLVAGCITTPPEEDPVMLRLDDIDRRLSAVERVLANGSLIDLTIQVDKLQREIAELRGQSESLAFAADTSAERQRDLYLEIDERIRTLEEKQQGNFVHAANEGTLEPGQLPVPGGTDRNNYQAAFEMLKEQRYEPAALAFKQFLVSFPDSQLADNAQYWLAESYYVTDKFGEALKQFNVVITRYPDTRKVPDALLKIGYCNYELKKWADARAALTRVQSEFAETTAARLAEQRLARMTEEGH